MVAVNVLGGADAVHARRIFGTVPTSTALQLLPRSATGAEWRGTRRWGVGASELPTVCQIPGSYGSPFALWWAKREGWETPETEEMLMGLRLEGVIGEVWEERNLDARLYRPRAALFGHPVETWMLCTPDFIGVCEGDDGQPVIWPVECKAYEGGRGWGEPGTDQVPPHIGLQVEAQCEILGATRWDVVRLQGKKVTIYTGTAAGILPDYLTRGRDFARSLKDGPPPPLDATEATEGALGRLFADMDEEAKQVLPMSVAVEYRLALKAEREAAIRKQRAVNAVRSHLGVAKTGVDPDGLEVLERRVFKRRGYSVPAGVIDAIYPKTKE
jgi:predicted phage-related endonuclease